MTDRCDICQEETYRCMCPPKGAGNAGAEGCGAIVAAMIIIPLKVGLFIGAVYVAALVLQSMGVL